MKRNAHISLPRKWEVLPLSRPWPHYRCQRKCFVTWNTWKRRNRSKCWWSQLTSRQVALTADTVSHQWKNRKRKSLRVSLCQGRRVVMKMCRPFVTTRVIITGVGAIQTHESAFRRILRRRMSHRHRDERIKICTMQVVKEWALSRIHQRTRIITRKIVDWCQIVRVHCLWLGISTRITKL